MLIDCLCVGFGGAAGAISRYLLGFLPFKPDNGFPLITMMINIAGAFVIGAITILASRHMITDPRMILFLKVGLCGGFTTFSSFSLETLGLLQNGEAVLATVYALLSVVLCVLGVLFAQLVFK